MASQTATDCKSKHKKGHMMNIYLTDSDEKAIVEFVTNHKEFSDKTHEKYKDKAENDCLWERFTSSRDSVQDLVQIPKDSLWKVTQSKFGQAPKEMTQVDTSRSRGRVQGVRTPP